MRRLKLVLTLLGFGLTLVGLALDSRGVIWGAIAVLGVAVVLRYVIRHRETGDLGRKP